MCVCVCVWGGGGGGGGCLMKMLSHYVALCVHIMDTPPSCLVFL